MLEPRGELHTGLDGCFRAVSALRGTGPADALADAWLAEGCAGSFSLCPRVLATSACLGGRCRELPPRDVPATWRRIDVEEAFTVYVPSELEELPFVATCGNVPYTRSFRGPDVTLRIELGEDVGWLPSAVPEPGEILPDRVLSRVEERLGDSAATRIVYRSPLVNSKETTRDGSWPRWELRRILVVRDVPDPGGLRYLRRGRGAVALRVSIDGSPPRELGVERVFDAIFPW